MPADLVPSSFDVVMTRGSASRAYPAGFSGSGVSDSDVSSRVSGTTAGDCGSVVFVGLVNSNSISRKTMSATNTAPRVIAVERDRFCFPLWSFFHALYGSSLISSQLISPLPVHPLQHAVEQGEKGDNEPVADG